MHLRRPQDSSGYREKVHVDKRTPPHHGLINHSGVTWMRVSNVERHYEAPEDPWLRQWWCVRCIRRCIQWPYCLRMLQNRALKIIKIISHCFFLHHEVTKIVPCVCPSTCVREKKQTCRPASHEKLSDNCAALAESTIPFPLTYQTIGHFSCPFTSDKTLISKKRDTAKQRHAIICWITCSTHNLNMWFHWSILWSLPLLYVVPNNLSTVHSKAYCSIPTKMSSNRENKI